MTPLERRCRRLLWLLPPGERSARGEEIVGLLCDVSGERPHPHPAEVLSLVRLALRLRLRETRTPLVVGGTALLVAAATRPLGDLVDMHTGASLQRDMGPVYVALPADLAMALVPLVVATAWVVGAVRVALAVYTVLFVAITALFATTVGATATGPYAGENLQRLLIYMATATLIMAMLVAAWRLGWTPPRPRALWLVLIVLSVLAWKGFMVWSRYGMVVEAGVYYALLSVGAVLCATAGAWLVRHHRWPVMAVAASAGTLGGWLFFAWAPVTYRVIEGLFNGESFPLALVLMVVAAPAHLVAERLRPSPPPVGTVPGRPVAT